jgi:hypothetical protein
MAEQRWQDRNAGNAERDEHQPRGESGYRTQHQEWRGAHGEVGQGEPPRYMGSQPGFGSHGMGYGPQSGASGMTFGVYGVPHGVAQDYVADSRAGSPSDFDQPHGRAPFGWSGSFGTAGEHSARVESMRAQGRTAPTHPMQFPHAPSQRTARRGPKNYQRSDERIREDLCERLSDMHHLDTTDVLVEVRDGNVTLIGTVPHRQMKHWIEDVAADCAGVKEVENKLRVGLTAPWPEPSQLRR